MFFFNLCRKRSWLVAIFVAPVLNFGSLIIDSSHQYNVAQAASNSYYVATIGADSNPGTLAKPFRTIQKCATVAQAGDTCYIRGGIYRETVTPAHSGTASSPITYTAYKNENVVVSGSDLITNWTPYDFNDGKRIYKAKMNWTMNNTAFPAGNDQIFVDTEMQPEARWPNLLSGKNPAAQSRGDWAIADGGTAEPKVNGMLTKGVFTDAKLKSFGSDFWKGAYITFIPGANWTALSGQVVGSKNNSVQFTFNSLSDSKFYKPKATNAYYLWGKYEALDAPGEWFRDAQGNLYLWTRDGNDPNGKVVEAKHRSTAFQLQNRAYIKLANITIQPGIIDTNQYSLGTILDKINIINAVHAQYIRNGWLGGYSAVNLLGANSEIRNSAVLDTAGGGIRALGQGSQIVNNFIQNVSYAPLDDVGINTTGADFLVLNNTVCSCGSSSLLDMRNTQRSSAMYNDLSGGGQFLSDGGAFFLGRNSDGQNTRIAYNLIHDNVGPLDYSLEYYGTTGIYLEGNTSNFIIDHNVVWNNTSYGLGLVSDSGMPNIENVKIYHNTVDGTLYFTSKKGTEVNTSFSGTELKNNIFTALKWSTMRQDLSIQNNVFLDNAPPNNILQKDPLFVDQANHNYQLQAISPAIARDFPTTDSYSGNHLDFGAYEYATPPWQAGVLQRDALFPQLSCK